MLCTEQPVLTLEPFFATESRRRQLLSEARSWQGTPFHAHGRFKHDGVDCVWLCAELYRAVGIEMPIDLPAYTVGSGSHLEASKVAEWVEASGRFAKVPHCSVEEAIRFTDHASRFTDHVSHFTGDLLGFKIGRVIHHVGIVLEGTRFIHAIAQVGVTESDLQDPTWAKRLHAIWRPICSTA